MGSLLASPLVVASARSGGPFRSSRFRSGALSWLLVLPLWWSTAFRLLDSHSSFPLSPPFRSLLAPRFRSGGLQRFGCQTLPPHFRSGCLQRFGCQTLPRFTKQITIGTKNNRNTINGKNWRCQQRTQHRKLRSDRSKSSKTTRHATINKKAMIR